MIHRALLGVLVVLGLTIQGSSQPYPLPDTAEFFRARLSALDEKLVSLKVGSPDYESALKSQLTMLKRYEDARRSEAVLALRLQDSLYPPERLPSYRISPWDTLKIAVSGKSWREILRPDGTIYLPAIDLPIPAVGLTASELQDVIAEKLTIGRDSVSVSVAPSYRISLRDAILVSDRHQLGSWGGSERVRPDGTIWLPGFIDPPAILAVGRTVSELQNVIIARKQKPSRFWVLLDQYVPDVSVIVMPARGSPEMVIAARRFPVVHRADPPAYSQPAPGTTRTVPPSQRPPAKPRPPSRPAPYWFDRG